MTSTSKVRTASVSQKLVETFCERDHYIFRVHISWMSREGVDFPILSSSAYSKLTSLSGQPVSGPWLCGQDLEPTRWKSDKAQQGVREKTAWGCHLF